MLNFREIKLDDKPWVDELLGISDFKGCEYTFANNLAWRRLNDTLICRYKDFYINKFETEDTVNVTYPAGEGNLSELISELYDFSKEKNKRLVISSVNSEKLDGLVKTYKSDISEIISNPDYFDYIYSTDDLISLKGKKYHGKRNHINRFKETEWEFKELNPDMFDECIAFAVRSYNERENENDFSAVVEQYAINTFFDSFEYLGLKGGALYCGGDLVGVTIGEGVNSDTFVVHIEKANAGINGAYPTLCNEFAKACAREYKYINREEDLGIEGLRKSKRSYNPCFLYEKHSIVFK